MGEAKGGTQWGWNRIEDISMNSLFLVFGLCVCSVH